MKKLVSLIFAFLLSFNAFAIDMSDPYKLANEVATTTIADIKANQASLKDNKVANEIIEKDLMPYIDVKYAAFKVIGTSLKNTSKEEREEFTQAFEKYLKKSLTEVLTKYTNQELVLVSNKKLADNETMASAKFLVKEAGKQDLEVVLKLRKNNKTGEWKAFDLIGENISILDAKSSEISPIIKNQGIKAAIKALNEPSKK